MGDRCQKRVKDIGAALALWLVCAFPVVAACAPDEVHLRGSWGQARFAVELADTPQTRARGLMHRDSLPTSAGMLFIYETPSEVTFWMRNTRIELDMIFADASGRVTHTHSRAQPFDETLISSNGQALAVLEINGGLAEALGLKVGSEMRHPAFDQGSAAWPCAE